jgi:hypothetical protein
MGKSIIFTGTEQSETDYHSLEVYAILGNEVFINIDISGHNAFITLDRETAIKFHRELKKQISYLESEGGKDGR